LKRLNFSMDIETAPIQEKAAVHELETTDGHTLWANTYDFEANPLVALAQRVLASFLESTRNQIVLDVGCGTGQWMELARDSGAHVVGIDLTPEMLRRAQSKTGLTGHVAVGDAQRLPVRDRSADLVLCVLTISYAASAPLVFAELARAARPRGRVLVADFHPDAVTRGWKRSFRAGSHTVELQSYPHGAEHLIKAGREAGLSLLQRIDGCFGPQERPIFEQAGKQSHWQSVAGLSAILATVWTLPAW
jgi:SAM-dependent methyltransferase